MIVKTLLHLTNHVVPLRLVNQTDQPQKVYRDTTAAWYKPVGEFSEANQQGVRTKEAPAKRASRVLGFYYIVTRPHG